MKTLNTLIIKQKSQDIKINFGIPDNKEELNEMFKLRFNIYKERNYIDPNAFKDELDIDEYDLKNKCEYFVAKIRDQIIGSVRLIKDNPLPTELYFRFETPQKMKNLDYNEKIEISRLVVSPYKINNLHYLPRHIIMLFLFKTTMDYAKDKNYKSGYSFVKSKLFYKLKKLNIPFYIIKPYEQKYPENGILYKYFNDPLDPVIPIYYFLEDMDRYFDKLLASKLIFHKKSDTEVILKNIFIYKILLNLIRFFKL